MQFLTTHKVAGGLDPRAETADTLLEAGVRLERHVARKVATPMGSAAVYRADQLYANSMCSQEKLNGTKRSREEYQQAQRLHRVTFACIPQVERARYQDMASELNAKRRRGCTPESDVRQFHCSELWGLSSKTSPLSESEFLKAVGGSDIADEQVSFNSWGNAARDNFEKRVFVTDQNCIPKARKFCFPASCVELHAGVCRTGDTSRDLYVKLGHLLWKHLYSTGCEFTWIRLAVARGDAPSEVLNDWQLILWVSHLRGSDPQLALFLQGQLA